MFPLRQFFPLLTIFVFLTASVIDRTADGQTADSPIILDCQFRDGNEVFSPQQTVILDVTLRQPPPNVNGNTEFTLHAVLVAAKQDQPPIAEQTLRIVPFTPLPISFISPDRDGVYEIVISINADQKQNRSFLNLPLSRHTDRNLAEIRKMCVIVQPTISPRPTGDLTLVPKRDLLDHAAEPRRQLLSLPKVAELPRIGDFPKPSNFLKLPSFGENNANNPTAEQSSGHFLQKALRNSDFSALASDEEYRIAWETLPMNSTEIGKPYLLEIDYPTDSPQTLGIGILERIPEGVFRDMPNLTAVNLHVTEEFLRDKHSEMTATYQHVFWAKSKESALLLVNRQNQEALFRNVRISEIMPAAGQDDHRLSKLFEGTAQRKRIGQVDGKYFLQSLSSSSAFNTPLDWQQSYEGCSRLIDLLSRGGYDGVTLTAVSKNSQLYSTAKIAGAAGSVNGLEMMFRQFDREQLTLIPAVEFDMPLIVLEQLLQQHPSLTEEILIGNPQNRQYNLLHPAVQAAMGEIISELLDRYAHHPSFGGISLLLTPQSYAQLPFALHPPDDFTFAQFRQDAGQELGAAFPDEQSLRQTLPIQQFLLQKNADRLRFLQSSQKVWETWVRWRARKVSEFYAGLAAQTAAKQPEAKLYLLGGKMFDQPEIQQFCVPTLPKNLAPIQTMQLLGFDLNYLSKVPSLAFLKPVRIAETKNYVYEGLNSADTAAWFSKDGMLTGTQFVHAGKDDFILIPAQDQSRKRFVQQLVQADVLIFFDGGKCLPLGNESALYDLLAAYRQLPPVPFHTFYLNDSAGNQTKTLQPLTIRYKNVADGMIVYIVNDAPFAVDADILFSAAAKSSITELTGRRMIRSFSPNTPWRVSLLPYDLLAFRINDSGGKIESATVYLPQTLCGSDGILKQKVEELLQRVHAARSGVVCGNLVNADFELPNDTAGGITGWQCFADPKISFASLDSTVAHKGQASLRLTNESERIGMLLSQPLAIPPTGRLGVSFFAGVPEDCRSLKLNVVLSASDRGKPFFRRENTGETLLPRLLKAEPQNGTRWYQHVVMFDRLPETLEDVRLGIEYGGGGTVWIDDIVLYPVLFSANEITELQKMSVVADDRCKSGRVSDLISLLEGYWTQFLFHYVPPAMSPQPAASVPQPAIAKEAEQPKPTLYQRMKNWWNY